MSKDTALSSERFVTNSTLECRTYDQVAVLNLVTTYIYPYHVSRAQYSINLHKKTVIA